MHKIYIKGTFLLMFLFPSMSSQKRHFFSKNDYAASSNHRGHLTEFFTYENFVGDEDLTSEKLRTYEATKGHPIRHHHGVFIEEIQWPVKKEAVVHGDLILGGLMMVHEREDTITCGPIMPQGGIQALEAMLYTLDRLNNDPIRLLPNITLGAHILDDCDKDTYGLEIAVDFIKGELKCFVIYLKLFLVKKNDLKQFCAN